MGAPRVCRDERGIALVLALLATSTVSAIALGLTLLLSFEPRAAANQRASLVAMYAAESAVELAAHQLSAITDWAAVLAGDVRAAGVDGPPGGTRRMGTVILDLGRLTNRLDCGRAEGCSPALVAASTGARPWGPANPRWHPFLYGPSTAVIGPEAEPHYLVVWVGDDEREQDDDPGRDAASGLPGHGVVRLRAAAFGLHGGRYDVEVHAYRRCDDGPCGGRVLLDGWRRPGDVGR